MLLDKGICSIFDIDNGGPRGHQPIEKLTLKAQSWYGELSFETTPRYQTEGQEDVQIDARIRIHQNRSISNHDAVILAQTDQPAEGMLVYDVVRAYHGIDDDNGQPITDLSLLEVTHIYEIK